MLSFFICGVYSAEVCDLFSAQRNLKNGKLTDYWAQEMIGADLLREEIEIAPPLPEDKFLIAVFSGSVEEDRNILVRNLISHKKNHAVLPELNALQIRYFETNVHYQYTTVAEKLLSQRAIPSFINNSRWMASPEIIYRAMSRIHPPAIFVQAARSNNMPILIQLSKDLDSILVGSLSLNGFGSVFSQEGEEVHILVPADNWFISIDRDGNYVKFIDVAPLVTGSLAGFEWLSGYHPTAKEAKLLLEQTAIPTVHSVFEDSQRNGVGMLNAYKLGMVAKRLKEKCHTNSDCFQKEIRNSGNYEFSIDVEGILEQTNKAFPECSDQEETQATCEDKKATFKKLRQALLLDIENINLLKKLQCIYTQEGFLENALNVETTISVVTKG